MWRNLKEWTKRPGVREQYFEQYFARYLFLHETDKDHHRHQFLIEAGKLYNPQNQQDPLQRPSI